VDPQLKEDTIADMPTAYTDLIIHGSYFWRNFSFNSNRT